MNHGNGPVSPGKDHCVNVFQKNEPVRGKPPAALGAGRSAGMISERKRGPEKKLPPGFRILSQETAIRFPSPAADDDRSTFRCGHENICPF
jgi:hypothetical protein